MTTCVLGMPVTTSKARPSVTPKAAGGKDHRKFVSPKSFDRPMFSTVFRPSQKCVDEQKELQFQEWRKKNLAKIKSAMQGRPKIYEYQNKPKVVGANNISYSQPTNFTPQAFRKLTPLRKKKTNSHSSGRGKNGRNFSSNSSINNTSNGQQQQQHSSTISITRRKRLTKTRPRARSTPKLVKLVDTSSDDGDSGVSLKKSDFDDSSGLSGVTSGKDHLSCLSGRRGKYIPTRPNAASVTHERRGSKGSAERRKDQEMEVRIIEILSGEYAARDLNQKRRKIVMDINTTIKDLVGEVIEHSMSEVRSEERHVELLLLAR